MNNLSFRVWFYHQEKFQYGGLEMFSKFSFPLDWCAVQRGTGLKDSTGKEIFEGDVVEDLMGHKYEVFWYDQTASFELAERSELPDDYEKPIFNWRDALRLRITGNISEKRLDKSITP